MLPLTPKAAGVLALLLEHRGGLVERQEILDRVWQDTFVEEGNLYHAISALRQIIGNDSIQTVARRGYRFAAEFKEVGPPPKAAEVIVEKQINSRTLIDEEEFEPADLPVRTMPQISERVSWQRRHIAAAVVAGLLIAALSVGSAAWFFGGMGYSRTAARGSIRSVAVLPLRAFTQNGPDEELRLRITDALITKLGRSDALVVRPTNAVLRFTNFDRDAVEAGKELNVDAVLDGRVQEENGRLRVTLQLVAVPSGDQLWSQHFDGQVGELLALQDKIADRFRSDLAFGDTLDAGRRPVTSTEAYEAYLKGRYLWNQRRRETYYKALEYFERSIEIDPSFALGYAGIADTYYLLQQRNEIPTREAFEKAEIAARKALELDPNLSEAHAAIGTVNQLRYARWPEAERSFLRAIELNPNLAESYGRLGMLYNGWGRFNEALGALKKAVELDPTSLNNAIYLGVHYYFTKQYDQAIAQFEHILEFAPTTERPHSFLSRIYELTGRYDLAVEHALKERELYSPESAASLKEAYRMGGIRAFWQKQIETLERESASLHGLDYHIASRYVLLGNTAKALDHVEKNIEQLGSILNYGNVDPIFEKLHSHPRFITAMKHAAPPS